MKMKKVDFVFEYEVKAREFNSVCLLAAYLKNRGYSVAVLNSWQSLYEKPRPYDAEVAVISACYNDDTYDYFTGHFAHYNKVVNMRWEQVLISKYQNDLQDKTYAYSGAGKVTSHVCWGVKEKEQLQSGFNIDEKYLNVVGYIPLDFYRKEFRSLVPSKEQLFSRYGMDAEKKTLLFVSSFSSLDIPDTEDHGNEEIFYLSGEISQKTQEILCSWFERFAQKHLDMQIVYRYHPAEKDSPLIKRLTENNKNIFAIQDGPISNWLICCDKIYNWCSTSMIEMIYSGTDVYLCRPVEVPKEIDFELFEGAKYIDNYEAFEMSALELRMLELPVVRERVTAWYDVQNEPAYQRLGNWLIDIYHNNELESRPSPQNVFYAPLRKKLKGIIKKFMVHGGITALSLKFLNESELRRRILRIRDGVFFEENYEHEKRKKDGYIYSKYKINSSNQTEINDVISKYQELIRLNN